MGKEHCVENESYIFSRFVDTQIRLYIEHLTIYKHNIYTCWMKGYFTDSTYNVPLETDSML